MLKQRSGGGGGARGTDVHRRNNPSSDFPSFHLGGSSKKRLANRAHHSHKEAVAVAASEHGSH
jgi:hypothetical protein